MRRQIAQDPFAKASARTTKPAGTAEEFCVPIIDSAVCPAQWGPRRSMVDDIYTVRVLTVLTKEATFGNVLYA